MFDFIRNKNNPKRNDVSQEQIHDVQLYTSIDENISLFRKILSNSPTAEFRSFQIQMRSSLRCCMIFIDEMINKKVINESILSSLMNIDVNTNIPANSLLDYLTNNIITSYKVQKSSNINTLIGTVLYGDTIIFIDGINEALIIDSRGWEVRSISEPLSESVVRGSREGFTESIKVNMSLIRRRILNSKLKFEFITIGTTTQTHIAVSYIEGLANENILNELRNRMNSIKIDSVLESGYIEELIKDNPCSPFKTIGNTERPDVAASKLLEGRIIILCDGTPFALTLPYIFIEYFQSSEDYYNSFIYGTFNRLLRILGFLITTSTPAMYVALVTFHQEMIPTPLFLSITAAREGVPLPTVVEALMMLLIFEIIREAGIRMPSAIGQAVSIVGALVLGDAAVAARVVSAPIVIVTAITGISSFLLPKMLGPLVFTRALLLILSSILGIYGYIFGIIFIFLHLMSIESFGVPYMTSCNSIDKHEIQDAALRAPWWYMYYGSIFISNKYKSSSTKKEDKK